VRALVQRVTRATVTVDGETIGAIGPGLCVLVGVTHEDDQAAVDRLAGKLWGLRILDDEAGVLNLSISDTTGELLVISQFTLYADTRKGRRPSFLDAARPEVAEPLVQALVDALAAMGASVQTGRFGADMAVALVNDGPVTVMLEV
jgi:D-tyrosyl-tRNA(Tyr) deacylase